MFWHKLQNVNYVNYKTETIFQQLGDQYECIPVGTWFKLMEYQYSIKTGVFLVMFSLDV